MKKIISIAGTVGSGKSTICRLLAQRLGYKCYLMGDIMRKLANENNMDIVEFDNYIKERKEFDNELDNMLVEIAEKENNVVFSSRTAWHFVPCSFKIYLTVSNECAAQRIYTDTERIYERKYENIEETLETVKIRNEMETQRYMDIYNIDVSKKENYDLYLDTSNMHTEDVLKTIISEYEKWLEGKM